MMDKPTGKRIGPVPTPEEQAVLDEVDSLHHIFAGDMHRGFKEVAAFIRERNELRRAVEKSRQAYSVMMRRGWHPVRNKETKAWKIGEFCATGDFLRWVRSHTFPDPFSALVAAEEWYVANVESA